MGSRGVVYGGHVETKKPKHQTGYQCFHINKDPTSSGGSSRVQERSANTRIEQRKRGFKGKSFPQKRVQKRGGETKVSTRTAAGTELQT